MKIIRPPFRTMALSLAVVVAAFPALAQARWGDDDPRVASQGPAEPSSRIDVDAFRAADAGDALGKGRIVVASGPATADDDGEPVDKLPVYEAAVIDQLAGKGYDIAHAADPTQTVQITVSRDIVVPEEAPHKPVSGAVETTISNRGTGFGLALAVDLSKPRKAILATRLDVRIRDKATGRVLWEGHAQGQSRLTDGGADDTHIATRLATALFRRFPEGTVVPAGGGE